MNDWDIHRVSCSVDQLRRFNMEEGKPVYMAKDMMLRDYFAAKAMPALISNPDWDGSLIQVVEDAYRIADLMMEERDK